MKIRMGFVSNSSSSSFICCVCGEAESGFDMSLEDAYMVCCENGHHLCRHHLYAHGDFTEEDYVRLYDMTDGDVVWEFPKGHCPVCQGRMVSNDDLIAWAVKHGAREEIMKTVKEKGYDALKRELKE